MTPYPHDAETMGDPDMNTTARLAADPADAAAFFRYIVTGDITTARWQRKASSTSATFHVINTDNTALCRRTIRLDAVVAWSTDGVNRNAYATRCMACEKRMAKIYDTAAAAVARADDLADEMAGTDTPPVFNGPAAHRPLAIECARGCGRVFAAVDGELVDHQDGCTGPADIYPTHDHDATFRHPVVSAGGMETGTCGVCGARIFRTTTDTGWTPWDVRTPVAADADAGRLDAANAETIAWRAVETVDYIVAGADGDMGRAQAIIDRARAASFNTLADGIMAPYYRAEYDAMDAEMNARRRAATAAANDAWAADADPMTDPAGAAPSGVRGAFRVPAEMCANATHDHTSDVLPDGSIIPGGGRALMLCAGCGVPCHYDDNVSDYVHDDADADPCPLVRDVTDNPCMWPAPAMGDRVTFRRGDVPACWRDRYDHHTVFVVVSEPVWWLGGQMDAETRAQIQNGHAHLIMADPSGGLIGTTAARVERVTRRTSARCHRDAVVTMRAARSI